LLDYYILSVGVFLIVLGCLESGFPVKAFNTWKMWSSHRLFFFHGIFLIAAGLPITLFDGFLSGLVFVIGCIVVLTGPFILLYPEKINEMFHSVSAEMNEQGIKRIVYFEAVIRILTGVLFIVASCGSAGS